VKREQLCKVLRCSVSQLCFCLSALDKVILG